MKKFTRILSVALVAVMVLSLSAVALAETPSVYIPKKLTKLGDFFLEDYTFPTLSIHTTGVTGIKDADGNKVYSTVCKDAYTGEYVQARSITEDSVAQFQFSEKPDWFVAILSSLDGGTRNIELDESGYGELEIGELHRQPGSWISQVMFCEKDEDGNKVTYWDWPTWMYNSQGEWSVDVGDYPYIAGKDYGSYSVEVNYHRAGDAYAVKVTLKDSEDFFRTGQEGGTMTITFDKVTVLTKCKNVNTGKPYDRYDTYWYVSNVSASYPQGNYISAVSTDWRNDSKQNLASYKISYAVSDNEVYKITYAPKTTTIYQSGPSYARTFTDLSTTDGVCASYYPSTKWGDGTYDTHYEADQVIYGEYYRNGNLVAVSGSGNKLSKWYAPGHGKQVKNVKKSCTSFKSPRVY